MFRFLSFILLVFLLSQWVYAQDNTKEINWLSFEEAVIKNETTPKKMFIDFYTNWCGWCKVLDRTTFKDSIIVDLINEHFYPVKFNAEQKDTINFKGTAYKFVANGRRGYHELAAAILQGKMSYPTMIIMDEQYQILSPINGAVNAPDLEPVLVFLGEDLFKDEQQSWNDYRANFTPKSTATVRPATK